MAAQEFDDETRASLEKVAKILRLAARNPNQHEAAAATAKAQELLAALNLDMAAVEAVSGGAGKRDDQLLKGGRFIWQRDLWEAVAVLNFCFYWSQDEFTPCVGGKVDRYDRGLGRWVAGRYQAHHRLVGRVVNIQATRVMAEYLEAAIARLTKERCQQGMISPTSDWAYTYRRGLCDQVLLAIYNRRRDQLAEETRKRMEAQRAAADACRGQESMSTALTLSAYVDRERDANADFVFGEGTSARWAADRAREAAAAAAVEAEYIKWAAAHPEEARAEEEKRKRKEQAKANRDFERRMGNGGDAAYWRGRKAGEAISLDPQASAQKVSGLIAKGEVSNA